MAGERYAKITIRASWSLNAPERGVQTQEVRFRLDGVWEVYQRGGGATNFVVPNPQTNPSGAYTNSYLLDGVNDLLRLVRLTILQRGLPYTVSAVRDVGTQPGYSGIATPIVEFDITSRAYARSLDLDFFVLSDPYQPRGWEVVSNVGTIEPVFVTPQVTDALVYGSATGAITLVASGGIGLYTYAWADPSAPTTATRTGLKGPAGYTCVVSDYSGSSTSITVPVGSDPLLDVQVQKVNTDVTLVTTGGVGPYTYQWSDGATTDVRKALAAGPYDCTVTDSHGAQVTVTVVIDLFRRFYFSRNPVVLDLAASNLASKPGLRFLCEVWLEPDYLSGVFVNIAGQLTQPADAQGRTSFDVSTLLDAYVQPDFPAHGEHGVRRASQCFKRFYLQHSEQWDGAPAPTFTARETHYLVYGGLDFFEYASQSYFTVVRPQRHPFLTWEPVQKEVFADQPEYLYYQHDSLTDQVFSVQLTLIDATGARTPLNLARPRGVRCHEVWRLGVGLPQLKAALGPAALVGVVAWEIVVQDVFDTDVSETRYYQLSEELPAARRYFLYANSIGGTGTLATLGKAKTELTVSSTLVQRSLRPGYAADAGEAFLTNVSGAPTLTVNTGYLTPAQMQAVQDVLLSEQVRYVDTDRYRAGVLQPADAQLLADDDAGLLSLDLVFQLPTQRRYTPALPLQ